MVSFARMDKSVSKKRFSGDIIAGSGVFSAQRLRPLVRVLAISVMVILVVGILTLLSISTASAEDESSPPLDCLSCHTKILKGHDKLGTGSEACRACHSDTKMGVLRLAGGETQFPLSDFPRLCAQCHQKRFEAWNEGTHGVSAWKEGSPEARGSEKVGCTSCHEPHQPQIVLSDITRPHPPPAPPPPPPAIDPLIIVGTTLVIMTGAVIVVMRRGKEQ